MWLFSFLSTLLPSPQLLFLAPCRQDGDSLPRSDGMSKLGKVWFPGPGRAISPLLINLRLAIHGLMLRELEHHASESKVRLYVGDWLHGEVLSAPHLSL